MYKQWIILLAINCIHVKIKTCFGLLLFECLKQRCWNKSELLLISLLLLKETTTSLYLTLNVELYNEEGLWFFCNLGLFNIIGSSKMNQIAVADWHHPYMMSQSINTENKLYYCIFYFLACKSYSMKLLDQNKYIYTCNSWLPESILLESRVDTFFN